MGKLNSRFDRMEDKINELEKRKKKSKKNYTHCSREGQKNGKYEGKIMRHDDQHE